jgi:hypothetical protein
MEEETQNEIREGNWRRSQKRAQKVHSNATVDQGECITTS